MRIVIVDTDPIVEIALGSFLSQLGHSLIHLGSSTDHLDSAPAPLDAEPDLLMLNGWSGGPRGLEILRRVHGLYPATPIVIIIASDAAVPTAKEAIDNGVYAYLHKPFSLHELELLIARLIECTGKWAERNQGG